MRLTSLARMDQAGNESPPAKKRGRPKRERDPNAPSPPPRSHKKKETEPRVEDEDQEGTFDIAGELKIDKDGMLVSKKYSIRTATLPRHPSKLYMLAADVSKALGYRDT